MHSAIFRSSFQCSDYDEALHLKSVMAPSCSATCTMAVTSFTTPSQSTATGWPIREEYCYCGPIRGQYSPAPGPAAGPPPGPPPGSPSPRGSGPRSPDTGACKKVKQYSEREQDSSNCRYHTAYSVEVVMRNEDWACSHSIFYRKYPCVLILIKIPYLTQRRLQNLVALGGLGAELLVLGLELVCGHPRPPAAVGQHGVAPGRGQHQPPQPRQVRHGHHHCS